MSRAEEKIVLVVDDEPDVRGYLASILKDAGFNVLTAGDGEEALAIARREKPDFISLDLVMPKMNGKELAICLELTSPETKVLFMSGYQDEIIGRHGVPDGGEFFIQKPVTPSELAMKVREILNSPLSRS